MAVARFEPMSEGARPLSYSEVQRAFARQLPRKFSAKNVERSIRDAFALGLVKIERCVVAPTYKFDEELAAQLKARFQLEDIAVTSPKRAKAAQAGQSDDVHTQVGHAAAAMIASSKYLLRTGDVIGVGSGRSVSNTLRALRARKDAFQVSRISVMSLAGAFPEHEDEEESALRKDANLNAAALAELFPGRVRTEQIRHGVMCRSPEDRSWVLAGTHLAPTKYSNFHPNLAIVGIGLLSPSHDLYRYVRENSAQRRTRANQPDPHFSEEVLSKLREWSRLLDEVDSIARDYVGYIAVAEVCNRFYVVDPPKWIAPISSDSAPRILKLMDRLTQLRDAVAELNQHLVSPTEEQLGQIERVILVAGTSLKAPAIRTLLKSKTETEDRQAHVGWHISQLYTDETAARALLNEVPGRRRRSGRTAAE